ncbi:unnamed protein product [Onchocerca ochengi]|uniref:Endostatin domain-containing protein n=1 Tax=Onchocerca ochengi TaxID=42157 RepID=A0A182EK53_ONCOC|nr:unnamed protein product [Onchocerca ochengi]
MSEHNFMASDAPQILHPRTSLESNFPQKPHQLVPDTQRSYDVQPRFDTVRRPEESLPAKHRNPDHKLDTINKPEEKSGISLPKKKHHHPSHKQTLPSVTTFPYQQTLESQHQFSQPPRSDYRPLPGQLYPNSHPLSNDHQLRRKLHRHEHKKSSQNLDHTLSTSQAHSTSQQHKRRPDKNRLSVKMNYKSKHQKTSVRSVYNPENSSPTSIYQSEPLGLTTHLHDPIMQNKNKLLPDMRLTRITQTQQRDDPTKPNVDSKVGPEATGLNTGTRSFSQQGSFNQSTISPTFEHEAHRARHPDHEEIRYRERPVPDRMHSGFPSHSLQAKDLVLHLIALNTPMSGNMRGVRGADLACYQHAREANFRTTFRAFLSSHVQDLNKVVHNGDRDTPVVNLRGERLFDSWSDIFEQKQITDAPIYSFNRRNIFVDSLWPEKRVWHGSDSSGMRTESGYCNAWRSASSSQVGRASLIGRGLSLLYDSRDSECSRELIVLCIENMSKYNADKRLGKKRNYFSE